MLGIDELDDIFEPVTIIEAPKAELVVEPTVQKKQHDIVVPIEKAPVYLMKNAKLRAEYIHRTDVLDMVGTLEFLPNTNLATSKQVAEFYGVNTDTVRLYFHRNKEELLDNGILSLAYSEAVSIVLGDRAQYGLSQQIAKELGISTMRTVAYTKTAILLMGFLLPKAPVTEKVRELVLTTEQTIEPTVVEESFLPNKKDAFEFAPEHEEYAYQMPYVIEPVVEPTIENPIQKEQYNIQSNEIIISGRELHEFLEVKTAYKKWFDRMVEYGFIENQDFITMDKIVHRQDGALMPQKQFDHALKLDMAKEISMIQRNEKGKQARQYFIQVEKKYKSQVVAPIASYMIDNPIERAKQWIEEQQEKMVLTETVEKQVVVIEEQAEVIEFKQNLIEGFAKNVPAVEQRKRLVELIQYDCNGNGSLISSRWVELYKKFRAVGCS